MSRRLWEQVEEVFETLLFGKKSPEDGDPLAGIAPDRTRNEFVSDKYEYGGLTGGPKSVRMLELLPGTRQQDIACNLTECSLDGELRKYDALSYVWGEITELTPIQVNGRTLLVTLNLRAALLNIRKLDQPSILWVDAVCIDQDNVSERNQQVAIMDDIYRNATRTIVWLGDSRPPYTEKAYAMVDELAAEAISRQDAGADNSSNYLSLSMLGAERVESPIFDRFRDDFSIIHLACARWWFRTWTVQEILLASQAVVMTGKFTMDWDRFCTGIDYGLAIGIWNPVLLGIIVDPVVAPYLSMSALRKHCRSFSTLKSPRQPATAPAQALLDLLIRCRFRQASDPRDKVYGLLGLKDADQISQISALGIEPDYRLSASQVFCHTARQLLLQSSDLNILGANTATTNQELPSWVPDWSTTTSGPHPLMHDARGRPRHTHASGGTQAAPRFLGDGGVLELSGHVVMDITRLSPVLHRLQRDSNTKVVNRGDTLVTRLSALGQVFAHLIWFYWELSSVIPHLATFWDWETFALESRCPAIQEEDYTTLSSSSSSSSPTTDPVPPPIGEGGYDPFAVYWQTLCAGTMAPGGRYATGRLFYSWRASLHAIFQLRRWQVDSLLRPVAFVGYLMRTWRKYSEFACLLEHVYERRLGRGSDGSLALLPAETEVGDRLVLAKGGRQPLVLRGNGEGRYRFVGEAYVHGIMDGGRFEEAKTVELMTDGETEESVFPFLTGVLEGCGMLPATARKESTGFIFNRLWAAVKREVMMIHSEEVSDAAEIDKLWKHMFHAESAPCEIMDQIGLDTVAFIEDNYISERHLLHWY